MPCQCSCPPHKPRRARPTIAEGVLPFIVGCGGWHGGGVAPRGLRQCSECAAREGVVGAACGTDLLHLRGGDGSRYGASPWWTRHRPTNPLAHTPWDPAQTWARASPGSDRVGPWLPTDACAGGAVRRVRGTARHRGVLHSHGNWWQARSRSPRHGGRHALHLSKHSAIRPLSHLSRVCASVSCLWHQRNLRSLPCA